MDKELSTPYYVQVAETIRRRILMGQYDLGNYIPSNQELEKEFNVSNITIRKALEILVKEGMIRRKRGAGTVVIRSETEVITFELGGSFQRLVDSIEKLPLEIEVLEMVNVPCPSHVQLILSVEPMKEVWRMKKVRKHRGTPISYYIHYINPRWCHGIRKEDAQKNNLVELFQQSSQIKLVRMEQRLKASVADIDLSTILEINFGAPLFFMENVYYNDEDKPMILTQTYFRGDMCSYKAITEI